MKNLDILIFTIIVVVSFTILFIGTFKEFVKMNKVPYDKNGKDGGVKTLIKFFDNLFS